MKKILGFCAGVVLLLVIIVPRFYHLGSQPPGLHIDEVSFAADAKAIAETGRDTWNMPWPTAFKAFGEWKAPGLTYSMAFWDKVLGGRMDTTVARLPSAIAGIVMLLALYLILTRYFGKGARGVSLAAVVILAFSPWHFDMSRIFYEALSAGTFMSLSLLAITYAVLGKKEQMKKWLVAAGIFAGLAGYWYASVRYAGIATIIFSTLIIPGSIKAKGKLCLLSLLVVLAVGIAWVPDLFSQRGLTRLAFYQEKAAFGSALDINDKRQYCYLSFAKDPQKAKICYVFWNKPLATAIDAGKTYISYMGPEFMFMSSGGEHGFDGYYGAYLLPLAPLYVIGFIVILLGMGRYLSSLWKSKETATKQDIVLTIWGVSALFSLFPAAISDSLTPRMGVEFLFVSAVMIGLGLSVTITWLKLHTPKLRLPLVVLYGFVCVFFVAQSLLHYFAVFTRSNDWQWTSDAQTVFLYVKSVSPSYDRIIDTTLHGPLAPYFYGDLTTTEIQQGVHSVPNADGWSFLIKAGKYELIQKDIRDLACEKLGSRDTRKTLVITQKVDELTGVRQFVAYTWNNVEIMHEVYDLDTVIAYELDHNSSFKGTCSPK